MEVGLARARFPAAIAASAADPGQILCAPPGLDSFLSPYPVDVLPIDWDPITRLKRLGIRTLGDLAPVIDAVGNLPEALTKRAELGLEGAEVLPSTPACTKSSSKRPWISLHPQSVWTLSTPPWRTSSSASTAGPSSAAAMPVSHSSRLTISRRPSWKRRVAFKEAAGRAATALRMVKHTVSLHPPPGPIEDLSVTLQGITGEAGRQGSLWAEVRR